MLCPRMSGRASATRSISSSRASKSGISSSIVVSGFNSRTARTDSAHKAAPPSGRSSRSTDVTTQCFSPISDMERASFRGSSGSGGNGFPVAVAQNLHERVHMSPKIMKVAVRRLQHSAWFGQRPLLQIVWSPCSRTMRATSPNSSLRWSLIFSQSGFLCRVTSSW